MNEELKTLLQNEDIALLKEDLLNRLENFEDKCLKKGRQEERERCLKIINEFDFEKLKEKYKPNMDLPKLIKQELKQKIEREEK